MILILPKESLLKRNDLPRRSCGWQRGFEFHGDWINVAGLLYCWIFLFHFGSLTKIKRFSTNSRSRVDEMVVVAGWMADERTTDHAQIVFKSHNECSKETTFRGKVVAEKENLCFTVIESFSRSRVGVISSLLLSTLLLLRVFRSLRETVRSASW